MGRGIVKGMLLAALLALGLGAGGCVVAPGPYHGGHGHGYRGPVTVVQPFCPAPAPRPHGYYR